MTKAVNAALKETVVFVGNNSHVMPSCIHEEADSIAHTADNDVIVILVGAFVKLTRSQLLDDIWIAIGIDEDSGSIALMQYVPPLQLGIHTSSIS